MSKYFDRKSQQGVKGVKIDQKVHVFNYISSFRAVNLVLASFDVRTPKSTLFLGCFREKIMSKCFDRKSQQGVKDVKIDQKVDVFNYNSSLRAVNLLFSKF